MNRIIAIGDIHGCAEALRALLDALDPKPSDTMITLGDYVDRGPESRQVIAELLELRKRCELVPLLGNHEIMMLAAINGELEPHIWQRFGGTPTLQSYEGKLAEIDPEHRDFLQQCRHFYESDTHIFMHANYVADLPLSKQPEQILFWTHISSTLPPPHCSGKKAVVGHTPQLEGTPRDFGHLICIDTCCFAGGWLTALDTTTGRIWQADNMGRVRAASSECRGDGVG